MLWDEPKIFFLERRYFFSIILSEFLKNRVALQQPQSRTALNMHAEKLHVKIRISPAANTVRNILAKYLDAREEQ